MAIPHYDAHHNKVDRRYRAKVMILLAASCLGFWGAVGFLALHIL